MPRTAAFTSGVLQELFRQLEYAPDETHRRQMDAAEQLLEDIQPGRLYPEDFIVFRITSYRSDRPGTTTAVVGEALRRDLVNFIQRLSWDLDMAPQQPRGTAVAMDQVGERLGVSRRTLQRCRRDGLVMHWVREGSGRRRLSCFPDALDRFLAEHGERIASASAMRRMGHAEQQRLWEEARIEAHLHQGLSLNEVAMRLAVRSGWGHETVRRLLQRFNASSADPLFMEHGPLTDRDARLAIRFRRHGVSWQRIARRFGKSEDAMNRAVQRTRRRDLVELTESVHQVGDQDSDAISSAECEVDLPHPVRLDLWSFDAADADSLRRDMEAFTVLQHRAQRALAEMDASPTVESIDQVETWLRWAAMLHLRAVLGCWQGAVTVIEGRLQQPVAALPFDQRVVLLMVAFEVICSRLDSEQCRAEGDIMSAIDAVLSEELERRSVAPRPGRASARADSGLQAIETVLRDRWRWFPLMPTTGRLGSLDTMDDSDVRLVHRHFGLDGCRPWTLRQLAEAEKTTPQVIARRLGRFQW